MPRTSSKKSKLSETSKKRARPLTSDEDSVQAASDSRASGSRDAIPERRPRKDQSHDPELSRTIAELKQKIKKSESDKTRLEAKLGAKKDQLKSSMDKLVAQNRVLDRIKKDRCRIKKANEKLEKDKQNLETTGKKMKKKMESYRTKLNEMEVEKAKLESKVASLQLGQGTSNSTAEGASGGNDLFQDMMDNFRELAETQLQCAICSELFVEAVSINCGHTFCDYCICEWRKKKNNCPVCRTNIKAINPVKVLDEYADKVFEQFVSEGGKQTRNVLKEDRSKLKKENEKNKQRRRGPDRILDLVNDSDTSIDSAETLEIRFNSDFDSDVSDEIIRFQPDFSDSEVSDIIDVNQRSATSSPPVFRSLWANLNTDTDSSDDDFNLQRWSRQRSNVLTDTESESSSSESSSSSSEEEDSDAE